MHTLLSYFSLNVFLVNIDEYKAKPSRKYWYTIIINMTKILFNIFLIAVKYDQ